MRTVSPEAPRDGEALNSAIPIAKYLHKHHREIAFEFIQIAERQATAA